MKKRKKRKRKEDKMEERMHNTFHMHTNIPYKGDSPPQMI